MVYIDVITGFLGAGKTTFANILLHEYMSRGEKSVYIVNEFGKTALDAELIRREGFDAVALTNGCVCCSLKNDLAAALREIVRTFRPTRIVFESSGVFVFSGFGETLADAYLAEHCRIGRVITVIDSLNYKKGISAAGSFICDQTENASVLLLSKLEKYTGDVSEIVRDIEKINPTARILAQPWNDTDFIQNVLDAPPAAGSPSSSAGKHAPVDSLTIVSFKDYSKDDYLELEKDILCGRFGRIFRVKGTIKMDGETYFLNIAMDDVELKKAYKGAKPILTFIGKEIDAEEIRRIFDN